MFTEQKLEQHYTKLPSDALHIIRDEYKWALEECNVHNEEQLKYIWDRYYKENKAHKRAQVGTGLGLSIVKGVIELHGGTYGVLSSEGKGSVFWFEIET